MNVLTIITTLIRPQEKWEWGWAYRRGYITIQGGLWDIPFLQLSPVQTLFSSLMPPCLSSTEPPFLSHPLTVCWLSPAVGLAT